MFVWTGMHQLESLEETEWQPRIEQVADLIKTLDPDTALHFELASMADHRLLQQLINQVKITLIRRVKCEVHKI